MNVSQQVFIINLKYLGRAWVGARGEEEFFAVDEKNAISRKFAQANFWAGEIRKNPDRLSNLRSNGTNPVIPLDGQIK
jgi:hypothetical protein